ncbi:PaaI family thioesterase [Ottowia thiooxydans]
MGIGASTQQTELAKPRGRQFFGIEVPFMDYVGLEPVSLSDGLCVTRLNWQPHLTNSRGDAHGGLIMSAMDFTLSTAARAHDPDGLGVLTIDMATQFYAPGRSTLTIEGRCKRRGRSLAFCDGEVRDENGTVVAVSRAVFKLIALNKEAA